MIRFDSIRFDSAGLDGVSSLLLMTYSTVGVGAFPQTATHSSAHPLASASLCQLAIIAMLLCIGVYSPKVKSSRLNQPAMMIGTNSLAACLILALAPISHSFVVPSAPHHVPRRAHLGSNANNNIDRLRVPVVECATSTTSSSSLSLAADAGIVEKLTDPVLLEHIATGGALALAGDVIAQSLLSEVRPRSFPPEDWDKVRTAAFVAFGAIYTGGVQHFIFGFLNATFDEAVVRLALAQFFFIPFCYYPTFLLMVPALRAGWESEDGFGSEEANHRRE